MNTRIHVAPMLLALLALVQPALAQQQQDPTTTSTNPLITNYGSPFGSSLGRGLEDPLVPVPSQARTTSLSPWILGANSHADGCCGPQGANGSIGYEIYLRNGVSVTYGSGFARDLNVGWTIQGGARALLFDTTEDVAWVVDFGITNVAQTFEGDAIYRLTNVRERTANGNNTIPEILLTGESLNRTMVGVSLGREYWLTGHPNQRTACVDGCAAGPNWRFGWDVGGRWGTTKFLPNELRHLTDVIGGVFVAAHTDMEIPCGACIIQTGFRVEWGYTWNDVVQRQNPSDVQEFLFMWNLGLRF